MSGGDILRVIGAGLGLLVFVFACIQLAGWVVYAILDRLE